MRIIPHIPRGAIAGLLAGSSLMLGGGLGAVAITSLQPAGALSAQVPAVGVREQNVNSSGRVRVALPGGSVNVGNLPAAGVPHQASTGPWFEIPSGGSNTVVNVTGSGTFLGLRAVAATPGPNQPTDCVVAVAIDGQQAFREECSWGAGWSPGSGILSGGRAPSGAQPAFEMNFKPQVPLAYQHSLVVTIYNYWSSNTLFWTDAWYTTNA